MSDVEHSTTEVTPAEPGAREPVLPTVPPPVVREWTLMFYFASDNPLAPEVVSQLKALKEAGFNPEVNVIAQFDAQSPDLPPQIFEVNLIEKLKTGDRPETGFRGDDPFVRNLVADRLWGAKEIKMRTQVSNFFNQRTAALHTQSYNPPIPPASMFYERNPKAALCQFLEFCRESYPARHYALVLLGHGLVVGDDTFLFQEEVQEPAWKRKWDHKRRDTPEAMKEACPPNDELPATHFLLLTDLGEVLRNFKSKLGSSEFEFIGFHSCSMSGIEVAYELQDTAKFMLASQGSAFVGSWPYREILIRLFMDLQSVLIRPGDIRDKAGLISQLRGDSPIAHYLQENIPPQTLALINQEQDLIAAGPAHVWLPVVQEKLCETIVAELNRLLDKPNLCSQFLAGPAVAPAGAAPAPTDGMELKWCNRKVLEGAFNQGGHETIRTREKPDVKGTVRSIFYYCVYNSFDFQLAGYSFDMCLADLSTLSRIEKTDLSHFKDANGRLQNVTPGNVEAFEINSLNDCVSLLSLVLRHAVDNYLGRELIVLAHWDAQSYWEENYTDLYDFCARLKQRCVDTRDTAVYDDPKIHDLLKSLEYVCDKTLAALTPGDDNLILNREFVGPDSQYSHGLSVFFPWSEPDGGFFPGQYKKYKFQETGWFKFLEEYFAKTKRKANVDPLDRNKLDVEILSLLERVSASMFNGDGELGGGGGTECSNKPSPCNPLGDSCNCGSIKNFPTFTRTLPNDENVPGHFPLSATLARHLAKVDPD